MLFTHGIHTASPIRHTGCIQPAPHKAHGVHTATLTRHTGCIQQGPQDTRGAYSHPHRSVQPSSQDAYIFCHDHFGASHAIRARCSKFAPRIYFAITRFAAWLCGASLKLLALTITGITPWHRWMKQGYHMPSGGTHSLKMEGIWHSGRSLCSSHPLSTRMGVVHSSTTSGVRRTPTARKSGCTSTAAVCTLFSCATRPRCVPFDIPDRGRRNYAHDQPEERG